MFCQGSFRATRYCNRLKYAALASLSRRKDLVRDRWWFRQHFLLSCQVIPGFFIMFVPASHEKVTFGNILTRWKEYAKNVGHFAWSSGVSTRQSERLHHKTTASLHSGACADTESTCSNDVFRNVVAYLSLSYEILISYKIFAQLYSIADASLIAEVLDRKTIASFFLACSAMIVFCWTFGPLSLASVSVGAAVVSCFLWYDNHGNTGQKQRSGRANCEKLPRKPPRHYFYRSAVEQFSWK